MHSALLSSTPAFVLASASPRRREILSLLGMPFEVIVPVGVDEGMAAGDAEGIARDLALRKARRALEILRRRRPAEEARRPVLGADTVVAVASSPTEIVLGKPADPGDARRMLRTLAGRSHSVWTGVAVVWEGFPARVEAERSEVRFRELSEDDVERYVASGEPFGKAGGYAIQGLGADLVAAFSGCFYNVVGLPLLRAASLLGLGGDVRCDCGRHRLQSGEAGCVRASPPAAVPGASAPGGPTSGP